MFVFALGLGLPLVPLLTLGSRVSSGLGVGISSEPQIPPEGQLKAPSPTFSHCWAAADSGRVKGPPGLPSCFKNEHSEGGPGLRSALLLRAPSFVGFGHR